MKDPHPSCPFGHDNGKSIGQAGNACCSAMTTSKAQGNLHILSGGIEVATRCQDDAVFPEDEGPIDGGEFFNRFFQPGVQNVSSPLRDTPERD